MIIVIIILITLIALRFRNYMLKKHQRMIITFVNYIPPDDH